MGEIFNDGATLCMVACLFDSGKSTDCFYGAEIFKYVVRGGELSRNPAKVVVSTGDVFDVEIYDDISPFTIKNKLCTVEKSGKFFRDSVFAVLLEDVTFDTARQMDTRIKAEYSAYLGMTSIDVDSTDSRKQFWKHLIRSCSIEANIITVFGTKEEGFAYCKEAENCGFKINYDEFPPEFDLIERSSLFSTRQSSFITTVEQLEIKKGRNDSDRGLSEMNWSLVKEVEIAGVQIWKAVEDIDCVYIPKKENHVVVDYLFTSWYQAAQGIERLLKILIELIRYNDSSYDNEKAEKLLLSHNHVGMYDFVNAYQKLPVGTHERKLLEFICRFYNEVRYSRFRYGESSVPELKLIQEFGSEIQEENFDEKVKHKYCKAIGRIAHTLYNAISKESLKANIYVYELNSDSAAQFALCDYYGDDLYKTLKEIENSKRELIWYLLCKGQNMGATQAGQFIEPLPFDTTNLSVFVRELICHTNAESQIYDFVSCRYDELIEKDKEKWKERLSFIDMIGNPDVYWEKIEPESDDEVEEDYES